MNITISGKILVVDDNEDDVKEIINSFRNSGQGVIYLTGPPPEGECPSNVRLLILDLDIDGCGDVTNEDLKNDVLVLQRINKINRFYLVALWSAYITKTEDWVEKIRQSYSEQTGEQFPALFLKPFGKDIGQIRMVSEITKWIQENPEAGLVFEWEKSIEEGRDKTVSEIANIGGIRTIVKTMEKEVGETAIARGTFTLFNKLLLRHSLLSLTKNGFTPLIEKVLEEKDMAGTNTLEWYHRIHCLKAYYKVEDNEPLWTGDILKTNIDSDLQKEYAAVITPACDFAQKKVPKIKVVYGIKIKNIEEYGVNDEDVPLPVQKLGKTKKSKWKNRNKVINAIVKGSALPDRFYILHFLEFSSDKNYFHLLIDFSNVQSIKLEENMKLPTGWQRICRIDSPYIEDLLQKYASFSARVGTPAIPEDVQKAEVERLKRTPGNVRAN